MQAQFLGREDPLEKGMATHSSILAWRILWTVETGGLQSIASQRLNWLSQKKKKKPLPLSHGKRKLYLQKLKFSKNHMLDGILVLCWGAVGDGRDDLIRNLTLWGFPGGVSGKESTFQCRRRGLGPWVRKIPWSRKWQPTPIFLPGEPHGQRSLAGYSPCGHKKSDTTEVT